MSEPRWTPGPWTANLHHTQTQAGRTYGFIHAGAIVPIAAVTLGVEGMPEDAGRANARLIAAAPELYELLREAVEHTDSDHNPGWEWRKHGAAILAKARGEAA